MKRSLLAVILVSMFLAGCAVPTYRGHPQMQERLARTKTVVMLPPKVEVYQVSAGGIKEKIDEWCDIARNNVAAAVDSTIRGRGGLTVVPLSTGSSSSESVAVEEVEALFDAVSSSILWHTYGPPEHVFQEKLSAFDYTMGPGLTQLAGKADALLLVRGVDNVSTGGRKALMTGAVVLGALVGVVPVSTGGASSISMALVDPMSGDIIWYDAGGSGGVHDLRDGGSARSLVNQILLDFPLR